MIQDNFDFNSVGDSNFGARDRVLNFNGDSTSGDKIDIASIDANVLVAGNQAFTFTGTDPGRRRDALDGQRRGQHRHHHPRQRRRDADAEFQVAVNDGGTSAAFWSGALDFFL